MLIICRHCYYLSGGCPIQIRASSSGLGSKIKSEEHSTLSLFNYIYTQPSNKTPNTWSLVASDIAFLYDYDFFYSSDSLSSIHDDDLPCEYVKYPSFLVLYNLCLFLFFVFCFFVCLWW